MNNNKGILLFLLGVGLMLALFFFVERRPLLFANSTYLGGILAVQVAIIGLTHFEEAFFPMLMGSFLWAGSFLPFYSAGMSLRWLFLGVGALGGFVIWIKIPRAQHFKAFHLIALFCVVSALVSALVSAMPRIALLKVLSLFLLFLYTSAGARVAVAGREQKFLSRLVLACEVLAFGSALCYFGTGFAVFGNPNSLGAIIGVMVVPILLWGAIAAESRSARQRRFLALALCGGLLYFANSRASIFGAMLVTVLFTVAMRKKRLLFQIGLISIFFLTLMAVFNSSHLDELISTLTGRVIYKQSGTHSGLFGSRLEPWNDTVAVVKRHPWFGSGFGTSDLGEGHEQDESSSIYTVEGTNREHGNSYLALAEYLGLLGAAPFVLLIILLLRLVVRVFGWIRRTGNPYHPAIPFALVVAAGLLHAFFEDWLFAVGSYLCVFLWVCAFLLMDLAPEIDPERSTLKFRRRPRQVVTAAAASMLH